MCGVYGILNLLHRAPDPDLLARMAQAIYGDEDPSRRFATSNPQRIDKEGSDYVLALKVPFVDKSGVDLSRHNGDLYVTVGNYRREITLPRVLERRETAGASIEDGELRVRVDKPGFRLELKGSSGARS